MRDCNRPWTRDYTYAGTTAEALLDDHKPRPIYQAAGPGKYITCTRCMDLTHCHVLTCSYFTPWPVVLAAGWPAVQPNYNQVTGMQLYNYTSL